MSMGDRSFLRYSSSGGSAAWDVVASASSSPIPSDALHRLKATLQTIWFQINQIESSESHQTALNLQLLESLKPIAYKAEDAIADCEWQVRFSSSSDAFRWEDEKKKVEKILKRYEQVTYWSKSLKMTNGEGEFEASHHGCSRQPTGSIPDKPRIVGVMDGYVKQIIKLIKANSKQIVICPLVGPPGTGDDCTTVAQHVYRSFEVTDHFKLMGWVFMSESFDKLKLAKHVYESIARRPSNFNELNVLQEELRRVLDGKRFLIVLDNVQTKKKSLWESLWSPLASVEEGGVVMILTQDYIVSEEIKNSRSRHSIVVAHPVILDPLKEVVRPELEMVDQTITRKGLPHPTTDHVLQEKRKWIQKISKNSPSEFQSSYGRLSLPLKRCIAYCSLFPDYHEFDKEQLIRLWIAEGFIHPEDGTKTLEDIGLKYFHELLFQFYFQYFKDDRYVIPFPLHDALLSTSEYLSIMGGNAVAAHASAAVRYASYVVQDHNNNIKCDLLDEAKGLRTFIVISDEYKPQIDLSLLSRMNYLRTLHLWYADIRELPDSLGALKHLRFLGICNTGVRLLPDSMCQLYNLQTLDLSYSELEEVPEYIGKLKQLRFLSLKGTAIRTLPDSIGMLQHLQTLELIDCHKLEELPRNMGGMISLHHLHVDSDSNICMPAKLEELVELQTLQRFHVCQADGYVGIKELKGLGKIRRDLNISGLCNVNNVDDCNVANLESKEFIGRLALDWSSHVGKQHKEESDNDDYDDYDDYDEKFSDKESEEIDLQESDNDDYDDYDEKLSDKDSEEIDLQDGEMPYSEAYNVPHATAMGETTSDERQLIIDHQSSTADLKPMLMEITGGADTPEQRTSADVEQVLNNLKPHKSLGIFIVQSYHGTVFPQWMGHKSFKNLWSVVLKDCKNCFKLPSFGLLPSLKYLTIDHMFVRFIRREFCVDNEDPQNVKCFPELLEVCFKQLYELEEWTGVQLADFPKLETFIIFNCPKLRGIPRFFSLETLEIENCRALSALPKLPKLQTLKLIACDGLVNLPNLEELHDLTVMYCKSLVSVPELPSLQNLWIEDCEQLKSLDLLDNCVSTPQLHEKLEPFCSFLVINCQALAFRSGKKPPVAFDKNELVTWFQQDRAL